MRPALVRAACVRATPTDFWVLLPRPSRAGAITLNACELLSQPAASLARARQSCHGLFGSSLGRVGCRFSGTSGTRLVVERVIDHRSPQPYLSWAAIRSWVLQTTDAMDVRSGSLRELAMSFEQQRRHPCRRWPFSVLGRFAPSHSERSRSSHNRSWGRASVSERLPV
jgi:hypothetical protein